MTDPRVLDAEQRAEAARTVGEAMGKRHRIERRALHADIYGAEQVRRDPLRDEFTRPDQEAAQATRTATAARQEAAQLRAMPVLGAAARIKAQREAAGRARLARARTLNRPSIDPLDRDFGHSTVRRDGPVRGL